MERKSDRKEIDNSSRVLILFIDDNLRTLIPLAEKFRHFPDVDYIALTPHELGSLKKDQIEKINVIFIDQFFDMPRFYETSQAFIDKVTEANPNTVIIETAAAPIPQAYPNSSGKIDRFTLITKTEQELAGWPKNSEFLMGKLKWLGNHAKRHAAQADRISKGELGKSRYTADEILHANYELFFRNPNFQKFLHVSGATEQQFIQSYYHHKDLKERALILHYGWQIVAVLTVLGDDPDSYSLEVQRLKDLLIPEDETLYMSPPRA